MPVDLLQEILANYQTEILVANKTNAKKQSNQRK
jgi:hypothetical protein